MRACRTVPKQRGSRLMSALCHMPRDAPAAQPEVSIEDTPEAWQAYCFGAEGAEAAAGHEPALSLLQRLDQVGTLLPRKLRLVFVMGRKCAGHKSSRCSSTKMPGVPVTQRMVARLLRWHVEWLQQAGTLTDARAEWLYAVTALVEKPLQMGAAGNLRQLLRFCAAKPPPQSAEDAARLHTMVAIAGAYFRQDEGMSQIAKAAYM